jgi:hypothetical protein
MSTISLPNWNTLGVIPPLNIQSPTSFERSPYAVSLIEFVDRFAFTESRRSIIDGFLQYRSALHSAGLVSGFQWIDGSFLEDIETNESRSPNDIDVVTFFELPLGIKQIDLVKQFPMLFPSSFTEKLEIKKRYSVDAFSECLNQNPKQLVEQSAYWYSIWSHRRNQSWKGYVQVELSPNNDVDARKQLIAFAK